MSDDDFMCTDDEENYGLVSVAEISYFISNDFIVRLCLELAPVENNTNYDMQF